jgi:hypothetical protein
MMVRRSSSLFRHKLYLAVVLGHFTVDIFSSMGPVVVIAQALLPGRKAFVSGVTLGYVFGTGAFATWAIGNMADLWGLSPVIQAGAGVGVLTALLALVLPATREAPHPQSETVAA